ncbi:hypothetical protein GCM10022631_01460 [Deinococcus rubellus]|uniref:Uncharacterized protein n=1 Tax=Deinococcus rubellus TaxID=1889240 RepID=A0ABY5YJ63_9DEIO|nr:hypothetical protein [Deinococcus rubellus]UWX64726.1 hypothetical protein N0D28_03445 [Deinococcus rubellus]
MNDNTFTPNTGTRAQSRTFNVLSVTRECGVTTDVEYAIINLTRTDAGLSAQINGQSAELERAVRLLRQAERVWLLDEVLLPVIGKPAARLLHIELGRLGYRTSASHYEVAAAVLGRDVTSLATLTVEEAVITRSFAYGQLSLPTGTVAA